MFSPHHPHPHRCTGSIPNHGTCRTIIFVYCYTTAHRLFTLSVQCHAIEDRVPHYKSKVWSVDICRCNIRPSFDERQDYDTQTHQSIHKEEDCNLLDDNLWETQAGEKPSGFSLAPHMHENIIKTSLSIVLSISVHV